MRKICFPVIALLVCLVAAPAFAWEFSMEGAFIHEYRYGTQLGSNGFFGPYDVIAANAGVAEAPNFFHGIHFRGISTQDYVSSSEAATEATWMDIYPQIRLNKAARIRGVYRVGAHEATGTGADTVDPVNYNTSQTGPIRSFASGQWFQLWGTAQTPWGIIAAGKRPFAFGTGLMFDGNINTSTESCLFVAPYGPFRFLLGFFPARIAGASMNFASGNGGFRDWHWAWAAIYNCGPLDIGTFGTYINITGNTAGGVATLQNTSRDLKIYIGSHYLKYATGRLFVNAELAHDTREDHIDHVGVTYTQNLRYLVEAGLLAGPMKFRAIHAAVTGGEWGDQVYSGTLGNTIVFKDYSLLMVRNYGSGTFYTNGDASAYDGSLDNALFFAARTDYAVAANLNLWLAVSAAWRWDRRTESWGCINLSEDPDNPGEAGGSVDYEVVYAAGDPTRVIPNDDLGVEVYAGFDWEILDGLRFQLDVAYWQPGDWFKHACVSNVSTETQMVDGGWAGVTADGTAAGWDRSIDPVLAFWLGTYWEF